MNIALYHFPITSLGPARRFGLWLQGCSIHCKNCIAPEFQPKEDGHIFEVCDVLNIIENAVNEHRLDGVTISGGEPFDQPDALFDLVQGLKARTIDDILVYSGYLYKTLREKHGTILDNIAALIDGPFDSTKPTEAVWKGSDNQKLYILNTKYKARYTQWCSSTERRLQIIEESGKIYLIGIPRMEDVSRIHEKLQNKR